ncbi:MAG: pyridoxal phosphatase, partial [Formivibrio sp.]|nr:pyridoxal phosphatase [Formivibrio sp.]
LVALNLSRAKGMQVVLVTGRHHVATYPYYHQLELDLPALCCNGTYAYDYHARSALFPNPLTKPQAHQTLEKIRNHGVHCLMYVDNAMTYEVREPHLDTLLAWADPLPTHVRPAITRVDQFESIIDDVSVVWKFAISHPHPEELQAFIADIESSLGLSCERTGHNRYDIAQAGNSKGGLLKIWLNTQHIDPAEVIAFGDNHNDISMLEMAGLGIAMENSDDEVKARADLVIGDNNSNAIAQTLRRYVLKSGY